MLNTGKIGIGFAFVSIWNRDFTVAQTYMSKHVHTKLRERLEDIKPLFTK